MKNPPDPISTYLAALTITQGQGAGDHFEVLPWQRKFVRRAFDPSVSTAALSVGRGNGKTSLVAGIACAALDGPLASPRGEVVIAAASFEQARIAFDHVLAFMADKLQDRTCWRVWNTAQLARIENRKTGARVRCLASDPRRAHGIAPLLVLADEPAQWPGQSGEAMRSALVTALGKVPGSRLVALGTRPASPDHWFQKMLSGACDYTQSHEAAASDPPFQRRTWAKANPSLKFMPDLEAAIRREAEQAARDESMLAAFQALRLNLGVCDTIQATLLDASTWERIEAEAEPAGPASWGIDLGTNAAQSSIAAYYMQTGCLQAIAAFPSIPNFAERGLRDGVGNLYVECARRGELIEAGENAVNIAALLTAALARFGPPAVISCDRWRISELRDSLAAAGVPRCELIERGMGFRDGG